VLVVVNAAGWPDVKQAFFDRDLFQESFPDIARAFLLNVKIFLIAEAVILVFALFIAVLCVSACQKTVDNSQHVERLRTIAGTAPAWVGTDPLARRLWATEKAFYEARGFTPATRQCCTSSAGGRAVS